MCDTSQHTVREGKGKGRKRVTTWKERGPICRIARCCFAGNSKWRHFDTPDAGEDKVRQLMSSTLRKTGDREWRNFADWVLVYPRALAAVSRVLPRHHIPAM